MPEIKHQFTGGKMNKDVDERLVPNGEYRDAMNIQVSTSEGSDVGTVQNILGNIEGCTYTGENPIPVGSSTIGSISDEKNDTLYWFVAGKKEKPRDLGDNAELVTPYFERDLIMRKTNSGCEPVFVDQHTIVVDNSFGNTNVSPTEFHSFLSTPMLENHIEVGMFVTGIGPNGESNTVIITDINPFAPNSGILFDKTLYLGERKDEGLQYLGPFSYLYFHKDRVLNFDQDKLITGINIIDDLLLWTDNNTEPKKINISRSIEGTNSSGLFHTRLINNFVTPKINPDVTVIPIKEQHITVIKKSPKSPLTLDLQVARDANKNYGGIIRTTINPEFDSNTYFHDFLDRHGNTSHTSSLSNSTDGIYDFSQLNVDDIFYVRILRNSSGETLPFDLWDMDAMWHPGTEVVLKEYDGAKPPMIPIGDTYRIKGVIQDWKTSGGVGLHFPNTFSGTLAGVNFTRQAQVAIQITSIDGNPPLADSDTEFLDYAIDLFHESEKIFEFKFPRFSYRYKYEDGEYSNFAPFTDVAFSPGAFDYHPKKGYNLGMTNRIESITISNFITSDIPLDVVEVDLLYKEEPSPNIYVVDTIKPDVELNNKNSVNAWYSGTYAVTSDIIYAAVASNQILRPWDNVPRKALAQEVTGNRVVYANYLQNYNLTDLTGKTFYPDFTKVIKRHGSTKDRFGRDNIKSIKSLREYQLGVVFVDEYGRETPVISNATSTFKIAKSRAADENRLKVALNNAESNIPDKFKYYKFFIKGTSGEYYNMAMDRFYNAEDGNYWLAFPSSDRNKVDIDTFLILKKSVDSNDLIVEPARYKILAIENEAPDFIKTTSYNIGAALGVFPNSMNHAPRSGFTDFEILSERLDSSSAGEIHKITDPIYVEFEDDTTRTLSNRYRVTEINKSDFLQSNNKFYIKLDKPLGDDVNFMLDNPDNPTQIKATIRIRFFKYIVDNKPQFDGRFFVKIYSDEVFNKYINLPQKFLEENKEYQVTASKKVYYMAQDHIDRHDGTKFGDGTSNGGNAAVWGGIDPSFDHNPGSVQYQNSVLSSTGGIHATSNAQGSIINQLSNPWNYSTTILRSGEFNISGTSGFANNPGGSNNFEGENVGSVFAPSINVNVPFPWREYSSGEGSEWSGDAAGQHGGGWINRQGPNSTMLDDGSNPPGQSNSNYQILFGTSPGVPSGQGPDAGTMSAVGWYNIPSTFAEAGQFPLLYNVATNDMLYHASNNTFKGYMPLADRYGYHLNLKNSAGTYSNDYVGIKANGTEQSGKAIKQDRYRFHPPTVENWYYYTAYFASYKERTIHPIAHMLESGETDIFTAIGTGQSTSTAREELETLRFTKPHMYFDVLEERGEDTYEDVWFIDAGQYVGENGTMNQSWGENFTGAINSYHNQPCRRAKFNQTDPAYNDRAREFEPCTQYGLNNIATTFLGGRSKMKLSFGGIDPEEDDKEIYKYYTEGEEFEEAHKSYKTEEFKAFNAKGPDFWNLTSNTREKYRSQVDMLEKLASGYQFRWKEDPTNTVYTIETPPDIRNLLRYDTNPLRHDGYNDYSSYLPPVNFTHWKGFEHWHHFPLNIGNRIENFFKNYELEVVPAIKEWDPIQGGVPGVIDGSRIIDKFSNDNGITLTNITAAAATSAGDNNVKILATQFEAAWDSLYNERVPILAGMALTTVDGDDLNNPVLIKSVEKEGDNYTINFTGYNNNVDMAAISDSDALVFKQLTMNGLSVNSAKNITENNPQINLGMGAVGYTLEFIEPIQKEPLLPEDPSIWETEPKESTDLDIYYEISGSNPINLDSSTIKTAIPVGSTIGRANHPYEVGGHVGDEIFIPDMDFDFLVRALTTGSTIAGQIDAQGLTVIKPDSSSFRYVKIDENWLNEFTATSTPTGTAADLLDPANASYKRIKLEKFIYNVEHSLNWHNCYSFGNGVESNRIRDNFNLTYIQNGVKASTTLEGQYEEEHRKYGLIFSGIYNSNNGVNNLNQFIQAEKITKDVNPIYGSIQKLHSRDTDLVVLCEDKILKILANKDAIFNADGNPQLTANINVLGQTMPFGGEFGISKNPESFASEAYRVYFADKTRGAILRLSKDGLTPISMYGMKDWFKDNLKLSNEVVGSYDDKKDEYNVTLLLYPPAGSIVRNSKPNALPKVDQNNNPITIKVVSWREDFLELSHSINDLYLSQFNNGTLTFYKPDGVTEIATAKMGYLYNPTEIQDVNVSKFVIFSELSSLKTVSFREDVKGWVSFKSFTPENAISTANDYYTFSEGNLFKHHVENIDRNTFYGNFTSSSLNVVLNDGPAIVKSFNALNYEGSQAKVDVNIQDNQYFNLQPKEGWYIGAFETNKEKGRLREFVEKEGKWFGYLKGRSVITDDNNFVVINEDNSSSFDQASFAIQGIGTSSSIEELPCEGKPGCTDPNYNNYDPDAECNDGTCINIISYSSGCTNPLAENYDPLAVIDDGSCLIGLCEDENASNFGNNLPCLYGIGDFTLGCTNPNASNYNANAQADDNTCCPSQSWLDAQGELSVTWVSPAPNTITISVSWEPTVLPPSTAYAIKLKNLTTGNQVDNYYITNPTPSQFTYTFQDVNSHAEYEILLGANCADGSYVFAEPYILPIQPHGCTDDKAFNYNGGANIIEDGSCCYNAGCTDTDANNYNASACFDDGSCTYGIPGCTDPDAFNFDINAEFNDGSCTYCGCVDPTAGNYDPLAVCDCEGDEEPLWMNPLNTLWNSCCIYYGCMDPIASNYDSNATVDDGSCIYISSIYGCMMPSMFNYNPNATVDDGSCIPFIYGCMAPAATNFNPAANTDDGSCIFVKPRQRLNEATEKRNQNDTKRY